MKQSLVLCLTVCVVFSLSVYMKAEPVGTLEGLMKPEVVTVSGDRMYIVEGIHIYMYSTTDGKLIRKVGKKGEGPQEFRKLPASYISSLTLYVKQDGILVNNLSKAVFLKHNGDFVKEMITGIPISRFTPLGNKYAGINQERENGAIWIAINLYDRSFKKEKRLYRVKHSVQPGKKWDPITMSLMNKIYYYYALPNVIAIPDYDGTVHVFGSDGEKRYSIRHDFPKVKVTEAIEKEMDEFLMSDVRFKIFYQEDKAANNLEYPEYLPIIKEYRAADGKFYVVTNRKMNSRGGGSEGYETFIFDGSNGKFLESRILPLQDMNVLELYPFDIRNGKVYQVVENDDEDWELSVTSI